MKSLIKIFAVILILTLVMLCPASADSVSLYVDGDYTYADVDSSHVALFSYSGEDSVLSVPEYFAGRYVSEIYAYAFEENTSITGLDFSQNGNRMKTIQTKAFNECSELGGDLILPSSVRTLGFAAFQGCAKLESLTVNYGVSEIPAQCFNRCTELKNIILAPSVESIGNLAFAKCTSLESVYLPTSVTYISTSAFNDTTPTLYVYNDSYSHQFAEEHGFNYVVLNPETPPSEPETQEPTHPIIDVTFILGDADGDGFISILDATKVQRVLAGLDDDTDGMITLRAAVDGDVLNIMHATKIQRYLAEFEVAEPIGEEMTRQIEI